jgi:hypothetical protein
MRMIGSKLSAAVLADGSAGCSSTGPPHSAGSGHPASLQAGYLAAREREAPVAVCGCVLKYVNVRVWPSRCKEG